MKNIKALVRVHLVLMIAMMCGTIGAAVNFIIGARNAADHMERLSNVTNILLMVVILLMLATAVLYLLKGYNKQAAVYYKAFMLLHVGVCALTIFIDNYFYQVNALTIMISILNACKIVILLELAFGKDLGKKKTWTLFYILMALDVVKLVLAIINMAGIGFDFSFMGYVTALIADGTIGLAVKGKYDDKDARGTV